MKKIVELCVRNVLFVSAAVTTLAIVLIVIFLFRQGVGLFARPAVEEGFSLVVSAGNPVKKLTPHQVKLIFDGDVDNWSFLGGSHEPIEIYRWNEEIPVMNERSIAFIPTQYVSSLPGVRTVDMGRISPGDYFGGREWFPTSQPVPLFGVLPLLAGTLWVSLAAILFALPFGLAIAIYMAELAPKRIHGILKPVIELLAGIPSVVYGFFGLVVLVPLIQKSMNLPVGETTFAGAVVLAIMALPTIVTVAADALRTVPKAAREASLALGASQMQTIFRVTIPYCASGILAAVVLGIGRAVGETMAVLMVTGNAAIIPDSLFKPVRTIPATIAAELGEAPAGGAHYQALFILGIILFFITLLISISVEIMSSRKRRQEI